MAMLPCTNLRSLRSCAVRYHECAYVPRHDQGWSSSGRAAVLAAVRQRTSAHQVTTHEHAKGELWEGPTSRVCRRATCFCLRVSPRRQGGSGRGGLAEGWRGERCAPTTRYCAACLALRSVYIVAHTYAIVGVRKKGCPAPRSPSTYLLHLRANQHKRWPRPGPASSSRRYIRLRQPREFVSVPASWRRAERRRPKLFHMAM